MNKKKYLIVLLLLLPYLYLMANILAAQDSYEPIASDCIIILGHSLEDGVLPGDYLTKRLTDGLELYENGYAPLILVTGGKGPNDSIPVAQSMKQWLINKGVEEDAIISEEKARNTVENFSFARELADEKNISSIIVVTNDFHVYRSMLIARDYFSSVSCRSVAVSFSPAKFGAYVKEPFSVIKFYLGGLRPQAKD